MHITEEWISHKQLPEKLKKRIVNYYNRIWLTFKGTTDHEILELLPETLRDEILMNMLIDHLKKMKFFPQNNPEILLEIARRLKVFAIPKGEFLCKSGEAKSEFFFILEGYAAIINGPEGMIKGILRPGDYLADEEEFNEGFSIYKVNFFFRVRIFKVYFILKNSIKAVTDLTISRLDYSDLKELTQEYSILAQNFKKRQNPVQIEQSILLNSSLLSEVNHLSPISENKSEHTEHSEEEISIKEEGREEKKEDNDEGGKINDDKREEEKEESELAEGWPEEGMKEEEGISDIGGKEGRRDSEEGEEMLVEWERELLEWEEEERKGKREGGGGDVAFLEETYNIDYSNFSEEIYVIEKISMKRRFFIWVKLVMEYLRSRNFTMFITFLIAMFNFIYLPLNMIFDYFSYPTPIIIVEMLMIGYLVFLFVRKISKYYKTLLLLNEKGRKNFGEREVGGGRKEMENVFILQMRSKWRIIRNFIYDFLYIIPFALIFTKAGMAREVYALNFIRLINVKPLMKGIF